MFRVTFLLAPVAMLAALAAGPASAADAVDYVTQIKPLFEKHCTKCHGQRNAKGDLRLHNPAAIREADLDYLVTPGKPDDAELLARLVLEPGDELLMPKGGDPLPEEEIALIRLWIEQGSILPEGVEEEEEDKGPDVPPAAPEAIAKLEEVGAQVLALFQESPLLRVTFAYADETAGDDEVALLSDVAPQVVWLNLARSEVTNAGTAPLATLPHLTHLHLELTEIGDEALMHLSGLQRLEYLNLYGTNVTDAGLEQLKNLKSLRKLYLWQTAVSYEAAMALQEAIEGLEVNLGWNHPEVAKRRLTKELERVQERKKDATMREEQAKAEKEAATTREAEIQKELEALNPEKQEAAAAPESDQTAENAPAEATSDEAKPAEAAAPEEKPAKEEPAEDESAEKEPAEEAAAAEKPAVQAPDE